MRHFRNLVLVLTLISILFIATDLSSQVTNKTKHDNLRIGKLVNQIITENSLETYSLLNKLVTNTGLLLSDIYVKKVNDTIFSSLIIVKDSKVIYEIDHLDFWNTKGVDFDIAKNRENFFGFKERLTKKDYIDLGYYSDNGKGVADDFTLKWNYDRNIFEVLLTP